MTDRYREDEDLVRGARRGDEPAREELVRRYARRAHAVALRILKDVSDAEDVVQDALAGAMDQLQQCRIPARFGAWLLRSVRNRALNQRAQRALRAALLDGLLPDEHLAGPWAGLGLGRAVRAALDRLPPIRRTVVLLHDLEEWTHAEIAERLQISVVTSRQHLFVARRAIRDFLLDGAGVELPVPG